MCVHVYIYILYTYRCRGSRRGSAVCSPLPIMRSKKENDHETVATFFNAGAFSIPTLLPTGV